MNCVGNKCDDLTCRGNLGCLPTWTQEKTGKDEVALGIRPRRAGGKGKGKDKV